MKRISSQTRNRVFYALLAVFAVFIAANIPHTIRVNHRIMVLNGLGFYIRLWSPLILGIACAGLGLALVILTTKLKETGEQKIFSMLTGVSAMGIPIFIFLNIIFSGIFLVFFDYINFKKFGSPFMLILFVCPIVFLIGSIGSVVLLIKAKRIKLNGQSENAIIAPEKLPEPEEK